MPDGACKLSTSASTVLISLNIIHSHCHSLQARQTDQVTAAATAEALSALLVLLVPPGGSPHDAPPPPGDLLTEPCLAGTPAILSVPDALASAYLQRLHSLSLCTRREQHVPVLSLCCFHSAENYLLHQCLIALAHANLQLITKELCIGMHRRMQMLQ